MSDAPTIPQDLPVSMLDFFRDVFGGKNWVLARRTPRIVARYGDDVVCVSRQRYREVEREWRKLYGAPYDAVRAELYLALGQAAVVLESLPSQNENTRQALRRAKAALAAEVEAK